MSGVQGRGWAWAWAWMGVEGRPGPPAQDTEVWPLLLPPLGCYNCSQDEYFDQDEGLCVPCRKLTRLPGPHTQSSQPLNKPLPAPTPRLPGSSEPRQQKNRGTIRPLLTSPISPDMTPQPPTPGQSPQLLVCG